MQTKQKYDFEWLNDLNRMMFPRTCCSCHSTLSKNEDILCVSCLTQLPRTNYHRLNPSPIMQRFAGRIPLKQATSFLFFREGNQAQILLHELKYRGREDIGEKLGSMFGTDLACEGFEKPDCVIPLPLHPTKKALRGYNQSLSIAKGLQKSLGGKIGLDVVVRTTANSSQTMKGRFERWLNVEYIFDVRLKQEIIGKHVLLVDDVVTTGATLEACGRKLLESGVRALSLATLASA